MGPVGAAEGGGTISQLLLVALLVELLLLLAMLLDNLLVVVVLLLVVVVLVLDELLRNGCSQSGAVDDELLADGTLRGRTSKGESAWPTGCSLAVHTSVGEDGGGGDALRQKDVRRANGPPPPPPPRSPGSSGKTSTSSEGSLAAPAAGGVGNSSSISTGLAAVEPTPSTRARRVRGRGGSGGGVLMWRWCRINKGSIVKPNDSISGKSTSCSRMRGKPRSSVLKLLMSSCRIMFTSMSVSLRKLGCWCGVWDWFRRGTLTERDAPPPAPPRALRLRPPVVSVLAAGSTRSTWRKRFLQSGHVFS